MDDHPRYWLGFSLASGIGPVRVRRLIAHFGSLRASWEANRAQLVQTGLDASSIDSILKTRSTADLDARLRELEAEGVSFIPSDDERYPSRLREIYAAPIGIYVRGAILPTDDLSIAVVGTRRISPYGRQATERLAGELARSGVTVVSGLAKGVDTCAHTAALEAGGRTIAVLGCGVDVVYPPENAALSRRVVDNGALVSEFPLGTLPSGPNFPMRNRIIAGLSRGTLVTEADHKSGALITARFAGEQGRDVYAVPGNIFAPGCRGTNWLIQQGARAVASAEDILNDMDVEAAGRQLSMRDSMPLESGERAVLALLGAEPRHVDELCRAMSLPVADVVASLAMLELKGLARQAGGMSYIASA